MGADWYATTVVGCEIPRDKLYKTVLVDGCPHHKGPHVAFCPTCGKKAWAELIAPIDGYEGGEKLGALDVRGTTDGKRLFVGVASKSCDHENSEAERIADSSDDIMAVVRAGLEPIGLWDPETFGIWCVMRCSY